MDIPFSSMIIIILMLVFGTTISSALVETPPPSKEEPEQPLGPPPSLGRPGAGAGSSLPTPPNMIPKKNTNNQSLPQQPTSLPHHPHKQQIKRAEPPPNPKMNTGKKIGLLFAGIVGIMQVAIFGFLVFRRLEISKIKDDDTDHHDDGMGFSS